MLSNFPYCAQTPHEFLADHYLTPGKMMFERNHNLIPEIDIEDYELEFYLGGKKSEPISWTFNDLKKLPPHELTFALACAGNKRKYIQDAYPTIKGLKWTIGAVGNAKYKGVLVRDLLIGHFGLKEEDLKGKHLLSVGYDGDFQGKPYEVSIPMELALDPLNEVMIAYEMNDEPIPVMHGYPVRLICPGYIGVRCTKWLHKLVISDEEADSGPQRRDYKMVYDTEMNTV